MSSARTDTSAFTVDLFCSSPSIPPSSIENWISDQLNRRHSWLLGCPRSLQFFYWPFSVAAVRSILIEKCELLEMRLVAGYIYKKASRWKQSVALSKKDNLYKDTMETASQSGDCELAEELLVYFIE